MRSIRTRLFLGVLGTMVIVLAMIYLLIYSRIEDEIDDLFDGELERSALVFSRGAAPLPVSTPHREVEDPQEGMVITIWEGSSSTPRFQSAGLPGLPRTTPYGFSKIILGRRQWRLFGVQSGDLFVLAAQPADVRDRAAGRICLRMLLPSLVVLPLGGLMLWLAIAVGLRPLRRITAELQARSHRDLTPIDPSRQPPDIAPVTHALNDLMRRLDGIIAAQRKFVGDAAHELLTPLTALGLQSQLLTRAATPSRQREAIAELQGGVSRALHLAHQLLTLARHGADATAQDLGTVELGNVIHNVLNIHQAIADARSIRTGVTIEGACRVAGSEDALCTLVSNLVDNAIKYSGCDGVVRICAREVADQVQLDIEDSGPGIASAERERIFDRFYRRPGNTEAGSGLGLSIAREIATRHGATIAVGDAATLGGARIRVEFRAVTGNPDSAGARIVSTG